MALGYTEKTWDNLSGKEPQPASADKWWAQMTDKERAGWTILGYTGKSWDNLSGQEKQPAVSNLYWRQLKPCGEFVHSPLVVNTSVSLIIWTGTCANFVYCKRQHAALVARCNTQHMLQLRISIACAYKHSH